MSHGPEAALLRWRGWWTPGHCSSRLPPERPVLGTRAQSWARARPRRQVLDAGDSECTLHDLAVGLSSQERSWPRAWRPAPPQEVQWLVLGPGALLPLLAASPGDKWRAGCLPRSPLPHRPLLPQPRVPSRPQRGPCAQSFQPFPGRLSVDSSLTHGASLPARVQSHSPG